MYGQPLYSQNTLRIPQMGRPRTPGLGAPQGMGFFMNGMYPGAMGGRHTMPWTGNAPSPSPSPQTPQYQQINQGHVFGPNLAQGPSQLLLPQMNEQQPGGPAPFGPPNRIGLPYHPGQYMWDQAQMTGTNYGWFRS